MRAATQEQRRLVLGPVEANEVGPGDHVAADAECWRTKPPIPGDGPLRNVMGEALKDSVQRGAWPKTFPVLTPEQRATSDDFMRYWHEVLPRRYGLIERFNHGYAVAAAPP